MSSNSVKLFFLFLFILCNQILFAQNKADSLMNELNKPVHDTVKLSIFIQLSNQIDISKDSTFQFAKKSIALAEKTKLNDWISKANIAMGLWYLITDKNVDSSVAVFHRLYERMEKENYVRGMALAYRYLGKALLFNTADSAIFYNIKSIELFTTLKDSNMVNSIKINLAVVYAQSGREEEGIALSKEGMLYADRVNNIADAGTAAVNVGYFYEWINNLDSAIVYFRKSTEYNTRRGDPIGIGHGKSKLADILVKQKKFDEALKIYNQVLEIGEKLKSERLLNYGYNGLAAIALANQNWDTAILNFNLGYRHSGKSETESMTYSENLYKAYEGKGDYRNALKNYIDFVATRDTFNNADRLKKVDELEAKFQNKEKQQQIELLNKENEIQQASVQRQQLIRNSIIVFFILALAFGGLLFNRFKLKKQVESQQALLTERKRISAELHDDLGAQLSTARMFLNKLKENNSNGEQGNIIEHSLKIIDGSINDLRKIMNDLQTSTLQEKGLIPAIEELVNRINELQQIKFSLSHHNITERLHTKSEHNLFRITQELINNTMKYAEAKKVGIDFTVRDDKVILLFEDDGKGFLMETVAKGQGLSNIRSRAGAVGGTVDFDTSPGKGFTATIEIPLIYVSTKS